MENMKVCPNYKKCNKNFCPLDPELFLRSGKKDDDCRYLREPTRVNIAGREFVSGGAVMPDVLLKLVPNSNLKRLNTASKNRRIELDTKSKIGICDKFAEA